MAKWTPDKVEEVSGVPEAQVLQGRRDDGRRTGRRTLVWCMGQTQHTIGNAIVRASCIVQLALGNIGVSRRRRQHLPRPRQRAGRDRHRPQSRFAARLLRPRRRARGSTSPTVWGVDYEWIKKQFASQAMMEKPGMTVSRWIDGVLEKNELIDQDRNLRARRLLGPCAELADARHGDEARR